LFLPSGIDLNFILHVSNEVVVKSVEVLKHIAEWSITAAVIIDFLHRLPEWMHHGKCYLRHKDLMRKRQESEHAKEIIEESESKVHKYHKPKKR
jgi:hypothetical protein